MPTCPERSRRDAPCPITLNPSQWICNVSLEIDIPAEWLHRSFHCL
ncbi:hypothetical protein [Nostoc sp. CHAB 5715]|nr:hypothetical protein [Nostoc sp. CHAB 5715]MCC5623663.1 hypothetical protein [Nostoc sp. CHAB 5715]